MREISSPFFGSIYIILPDSKCCKPAIDSNNSFCPLFEIPAIPRTSPELAVNETSDNLDTPSLSLTVKPLTFMRGLTSLGSGRSIFSETARPTIILVISAALVSLVSIPPTYLPRRNTSTRSDIASTSYNLWVMMTIAFPSFLIFRKTSKSFPVS